VKPPPFDYHAPSSLGEALELKASLGPDALWLAGGQSLVPLLNMRMARPAAIIDLNRIAELAYVRPGDGGVAVGALTRQRDLERSDEAFALCPSIREGLSLVGHAAIRNRGTVGGSIAHADPAAELPTVLALLGGSVTLTSPTGTREVAAADFLRFHFTTAIEPEELVTEVFFPAPGGGTGHSFLELSRRRGDFAICGAACLVRGDGVRLALCGVGARPIVVESADRDAIAAAIEPASDIHATAEYRREAVAVLAQRAVTQARTRMEKAS
jgi:carbon-monoxide dehydrogenase medium subunit